MFTITYDAGYTFTSFIYLFIYSFIHSFLSIRKPSTSAVRIRIEKEWIGIGACNFICLYNTGGEWELLSLKRCSQTVENLFEKARKQNHVDEETNEHTIERTNENSCTYEQMHVLHNMICNTCAYYYMNLGPNIEGISKRRTN